MGSREIPGLGAGGWWGLVLLFLFSIIVSATILASGFPDLLATPVPVKISFLLETPDEHVVPTHTLPKTHHGLQVSAYKGLL